MLLKACGVISAIAKFAIHTVLVDMPVICTRCDSGAISAEYRKLSPRKPTGKKQLKRKMNAPAMCVSVYRR